MRSAADIFADDLTPPPAGDAPVSTWLAWLDRLEPGEYESASRETWLAGLLAATSGMGLDGNTLTDPRLDGEQRVALVALGDAAEHPVQHVCARVFGDPDSEFSGIAERAIRGLVAAGAIVRLSHGGVVRA